MVLPVAASAECCKGAVVLRRPHVRKDGLRRLSRERCTHALGEA
jgi:hypothetical protein